MATTKWVLDPTHSELQFKVKHLMITTVTGRFNDFSLELSADSDDFENAKISFKAKVDSIDTGNTDRDAHLRNGDFFSTDEFPEITFESTSFKKDGEDFKLTGDLTIKGVTKAVNVDVEFNGRATDPWGNNKAGFSIATKFNRTDFNLSYNSVLETGGVVISEEVKIIGELQFVSQA